MSMNEEELVQMGRSVYETICAMLDDREYNYERHDDENYISCTLRGEDFPIEIIFHVREKLQIVQLISPLTFNIKEDRRTELAYAISYVNDHLINGCFDYNISNGRVSFRLASSYIDSILGKGLFDYMLMVSATTVDEYNDKFLMLSKGVVSLEQFLENEQNDQ